MSVGIHVGAPLVDNLKHWFDTWQKSDVAQIFTHGPHSVKVNAFDHDALKMLCRQKRIYVHSSYRTSFKNMDHSREQLELARDLGCRGVVIHIPLMEPTEVANAAAEMVAMHGAKVILEMKAVKPHDTCSYETPEKINTLVEHLKHMGLTSDAIGICIDTAHIAAGKQQIRKYKDAVVYLERLKYPEYVCLLHLNGNEFDGQVRAGDKHILPFRKDIDGDTAHNDKVWGGRKYAASGCKAFVEWFLSRNKDIIIECAWDESLKDFINLLT